MNRAMASRTARWLNELSRFQVSKAEQLREKSNQWFDEVCFLHEHKRRAALVYLGGFVIECMLKSALWQRRHEPAIAVLIGRSHDLHKLLNQLPLIEAKMRTPLADSVRSSFDVLANWTVRIRYNPKRPSPADALDYWGRLKEVRLWLLGEI